MKLQLYSGAQNRFLLHELSANESSDSTDWPEIARRGCQLPCFAGERADGLLLLEKQPGAGWRMILFNADGSRPEACGNGLRCCAWHLSRTGHGQEFAIQTDAGPRSVAVMSSVESRAELYANMGTPAPIELTASLPRVPGLLQAAGFDLGNPHCVLRVADEQDLDVAGIGASLQEHANYPNGVNVGFLAERCGVWHLRVFERGVGETQACGTGACAAAASLESEDPVVDIQMRGGHLQVRRGQDGSLELFGDAVHRGETELSMPRMTHGPAAAATPTFPGKG